MKIQSRMDSDTGKVYVHVKLTNKELLDLVDDKVVIEDTKLLCVNIVMKESADGKSKG